MSTAPFTGETFVVSFVFDKEMDHASLQNKTSGAGIFPQFKTQEMMHLSLPLFSPVCNSAGIALRLRTIFPLEGIFSGSKKTAQTITHCIHNAYKHRANWHPVCSSNGRQVSGKKSKSRPQHPATHEAQILNICFWRVPYRLTESNGSTGKLALRNLSGMPKREYSHFSLETGSKDRSP